MKNVFRGSLLVSCLVAARVWSAEEPVLEKAVWLKCSEKIGREEQCLIAEVLPVAIRDRLLGAGS